MAYSNKFHNQHYNIGGKCLHRSNGSLQPFPHLQLKKMESYQNSLKKLESPVFLTFLQGCQNLLNPIANVFVFGEENYLDQLKYLAGLAKFYAITLYLRRYI